MVDRKRFSAGHQRFIFCFVLERAVFPRHTSPSLLQGYRHPLHRPLCPLPTCPIEEKHRTHCAQKRLPLYELLEFVLPFAASILVVVSYISSLSSLLVLLGQHPVPAFRNFAFLGFSSRPTSVPVSTLEPFKYEREEALY